MVDCLNCGHTLFFFGDRIWLHKFKVKVRSKWKNESKVRCQTDGCQCEKPVPDYGKKIEVVS